MELLGEGSSDVVLLPPWVELEVDAPPSNLPKQLTQNCGVNTKWGRTGRGRAVPTSCGRLHPGHTPPNPYLGFWWHGQMHRSMDIL